MAHTITPKPILYIFKTSSERSYQVQCNASLFSLFSLVSLLWDAWNQSYSFGSNLRLGHPSKLGTCCTIYTQRLYLAKTFPPFCLWTSSILWRLLCANWEAAEEMREAADCFLLFILSVGYSSLQQQTKECLPYVCIIHTGQHCE